MTDLVAELSDCAELIEFFEFPKTATTMRQAAARMADLEAKLAEAQKDSERLDWLDDSGCSVSLANLSIDPEDGQGWYVDDGVYGDGMETIRAAIDAAKEGER